MSSRPKAPADLGLNLPFSLWPCVGPDDACDPGFPHRSSRGSGALFRPHDPSQEIFRHERTDGAAEAPFKPPLLTKSGACAVVPCMDEIDSRPEFPPRLSEVRGSREGLPRAGSEPGDPGAIDHEGAEVGRAVPGAWERPGHCPHRAPGQDFPTLWLVLWMTAERGTNFRFLVRFSGGGDPWTAQSQKTRQDWACATSLHQQSTRSNAARESPGLRARCEVNGERLPRTRRREGAPCPTGRVTKLAAPSLHDIGGG